MDKNQEEELKYLEEKIAKYENFPKEGIIFYDIFSLLNNPKLASILYSQSQKALESFINKNKLEPTTLIGLESRGFLIGAVLADRLKLSFVPIRKKNKKNTKLPGKILSINYGTEYSEDAFDLQEIAIKKGESKVIIVDDLLATGGSMQACETLIKQAGGEVLGYFCPFELVGLKGKDKLDKPDNLMSLIKIK